MTKTITDISAMQQKMTTIMSYGKESARVDNPVGISLTPKFIDYDTYSLIKADCENILNAIEKIIQLYVTQDMFRSFFPELEQVAELIKIVPSFDRTVWLARFDIVESADGGYKIVETNTNCPGGLTRVHSIHETFSNSIIFESLTKEFDLHITSMQTPCFIASELLRKFRFAPKGHSNPSVCILNSKNGNLLTDVDLLTSDFSSLGIRARQAYVQDLCATQSGRVGWSNKEAIDLSFHKVGAYVDHTGYVRHRFFFEHPTEILPYWHAMLDGSVSFVNSFPSMFLADSKKILMILHIAAARGLLLEPEIEAISRMVPRSFPVSSSNLDFPSCAELKAHKNNFVLKMTNDSRGRNVIIGISTTQNAWEEAIDQAQKSSWIAQDYVNQEPEITWTASEPFQQVPMYHNFGAFIVDGTMSGMFCRASPNPLVSVAHKAVFRPVYIVKDKK